MIAAMLTALAAQVAPAPAPALASAPTVPDPVVARMLSLYDEICLKTFPDDAALDALMAKKGATPLTREQIAVTLRDDPGRGWLIDDGDRTIQVTLELPPYHACSVRRMVPAGTVNLTPYRALADLYKATHPGFTVEAPLDRTIGDLQIHADSERRVRPDGKTEALLVFDQRMADESKRKAGESNINLRFVHQIIDRDAK